jgi:hypothetical protein
MYRSLLSLSLLATGLNAQGLVPRATLRAIQKHPALCTPAVPATDTQQIHMVRLPGDPAGTYTVALTVTGLSAANGGVGGMDILTGKYDALADVFTPDLHAAAVNSAGTEFGFMIHSNGLVAVIDRLSSVLVATRANVVSPWVPKGTVTGLPAGPGYFDPAVANIGGQLVLLYVTGSAASASIAYSPLDINTLAAGPAVILVRPNRTSGGQANSPTPIVTSTGELVALSHHDVVGSDNDHYMSMDLDPNTASVLFIDTTTWINNGGFAGGTFFDAESVAPYQITSTQSAWWTGGRAAIGTNMEITINVPPKSSGAPHLSFIMLSRAFLPTPLAIPGVTNLLGIDPTSLILINAGTHVIQTGQATVNIGVPNDASLSNLAIPGQSLSIDLTSSALILGNTAALTIL